MQSGNVFSPIVVLLGQGLCSTNLTPLLSSFGSQRCFHGRKSFISSEEHPRVVMGCYVSQDELYSRFRMEGYDI
jgi:hypothetical protein